LQDAHLGELRVGAQLCERDQRQLLLELDVDADPARRIARRFRIVVRALAVELGVVRRAGAEISTMPAIPGSGQLEW
jgi:hypothetical protein